MYVAIKFCDPCDHPPRQTPEFSSDLAIDNRISQTHCSTRHPNGAFGRQDLEHTLLHLRCVYGPADLGAQASNESFDAISRVLRGPPCFMLTIETPQNNCGYDRTYRTNRFDPSRQSVIGVDPVANNLKKAPAASQISMSDLLPSCSPTMVLAPPGGRKMLARGLAADKRCAPR
jgi:hypothetical protein